MHAALIAGGHEGALSDFLVDFLGGDKADDAVLYEVAELFFPCLQELLVGSEGLRILFRDGNLDAGEPALSFIQGKLQRCSKADGAGGGPLEGLPGVRNNAPAIVPVSGVDRIVAEVGEHLVAGPVAVNGGEAAPGGDQLGHCLHELRRAVRLNAAAQGRLVGHDLPRGLDGQVRDFVDRI